ncbi:hypothetical protein O981_14930 [Mycobacterium avium 10-5560]|nr:hypothetical protein O981_14930 [Mycobacterium avium 10-5560]
MASSNRVPVAAHPLLVHADRKAHQLVPAPSWRIPMPLVVRLVWS